MPVTHFSSFVCCVAPHAIIVRVCVCVCVKLFAHVGPLPKCVYVSLHPVCLYAAMC